MLVLIQVSVPLFVKWTYDDKLARLQAGEKVAVPKDDQRPKSSKRAEDAMKMFKLHYGGGWMDFLKPLVAQAVSEAGKTAVLEGSKALGKATGEKLGNVAGTKIGNKLTGHGVASHRITLKNLGTRDKEHESKYAGLTNATKLRNYKWNVDLTKSQLAKLRRGNGTITLSKAQLDNMANAQGFIHVTATQKNQLEKARMEGRGKRIFVEVASKKKL